MSTPTSRPVHASVMSVFNGSTGAEYSTWARLGGGSDIHLVTALANSLRVYDVIHDTYDHATLLLKHSFTLAGSVVFLDKLSSPHEDALLIGFAGHPRVVVCTLQETTISSYPILQASSLLNLTPALTEASFGSVTPLEQDLQACLRQEEHRSHVATLSVVLGGGVAVATVTLLYSFGEWHAAGEPYLLPLSVLNKSLLSTTTTSTLATEKATGTASSQTAANVASIAHGFGDVISVCFLEGYLEPTLAVLHSSSKMERTWPGRLTGTNYMNVSAMSVNVQHQGSAVLWSVHVPADACMLQTTKSGVLVTSVNSILLISNSGTITSNNTVLGVNGWVRSTLPPHLNVMPNPWPLPKLAIQLDGARITLVSDTLALVAVRRGQLYLLNISNNKTLSLLPLGRTLGAIGQVAHLSAFPTLQEEKDGGGMLRGLLFGASRLGDCSLLSYTIQPKVAIATIDKSGGSGNVIVVKQEEGVDSETIMHGLLPPELETIFAMEEDALYAPTTHQQSTLPDIIPPSDDEQEQNVLVSSSSATTRTRLRHVAVLKSLTALDSITCLGPVGPGCLGPLSSSHGGTSSASIAATLAPNAQVLPCGYGSSGGLALVTTPGRDDRTILAEADCLNMDCVYYLPRKQLVIMGRNNGDGMSLLRYNNQEEELTEVDLLEYCGGGEHKQANEDDESLWNALYVFTKTTLVIVSELSDEFDESYMVYLVKQQDDNYSIVVVMAEADDDNKTPQVKFVYQVGPGQGTLLSATPMVRHDDDWSPTLYFGSTWSSGNGVITTIRPPNQNDEEFTGSETVLLGDAAEKMKIDNDEDEESVFYSSDRIVSMDVFQAPKGTFAQPTRDSTKQTKAIKKETIAVKTSAVSLNGEEIEFDEEDLELYGPMDVEESTTPSRPSLNTTRVRPSKEKELYIGVCRQSGLLQIYRLPVVGGTTMDPQLSWEAPGCGHGIPLLAPAVEGTASPRRPRMHKVQTAEFRFFVCGPSSKGLPSKSFPTHAFQKFCLAMETSAGDVYLYAAQPSSPQTGTTFVRVAFGVVARPSNEQARHRAKLKRKKILPSSADNVVEGVRYNRLHSFSGISGQDGLFSATARPMWFVSERGAPTFLCHRSRHVAPAGGKLRPIAGFCSGMLLKQKQSKTQGAGFITLHERIGRVGSQRLTVFRGISNVYSPHGLFPGSGLCIEKVPLGVTVRRIEFLDDVTVSTPDHPLYSVLISREVESDQSYLNDDGLTAEERQLQKDEKETDKVKRQVEADLGGFDIEQEWVEEIERENYFEIDKNIGGAPPVPKSAYALWIVDASSNWNVVDSYELGEYEHGMTMKVMPLTEVADETGKSSAIGETEESDTLFITVGTGIVDQDGEDVSSKGRVLLFTVTRHRTAGAGAIADLSLLYEKDIMHGPVTSLSCLASEGRSRLIIGAGSDVNVEQWGNGKLTQVGFFRAQMQILDIMLFKQFFLLSDAYDSLYFLVWRESDKSLTLLAKDYEPIPVYASGIMSRGGSVSFICMDDRQNLEFFQYAPGDAAARGGNKLVCRADFHLGTQTALGMQSHYCRSSLLINSATPTSTLEALKQQDSLVGRTDDDQRMGVYFGTTDGTYTAIIPLSEPAYWRLTALQSVLTNALEANCALSTRAWRLYRRTPRRGGCRSNDRKKGVIDGDLCTQYADLPLPDQEDLASAIGSTVDTILDNLLELKCSSMVI